MKDWSKKRVFRAYPDEIEEENQMYISDKKKQRERETLRKNNSLENANHTELQEHISDNELQLKLKRLESSM